MLLIVGLGNPGPKYETTRHNAGALLLDEILYDLKIELKEQAKFKARIGRGQIYGVDTIFLRPSVYMNLSGQSVAPVLNFFSIPCSQLIVLYDDLDLSIGMVKMRQGGSSGGHNGIKDIIEKTGKDDFYRIKIGIGRPENSQISVTNWVLGQLSDQELLSYQGPVKNLVEERLQGIVKQLKI
ncbi:MAG: aminoacyl-tRNA hydrolase [Oligoflexales bacterium]|nr:aminoacyl-tRNA hydrolase [Oligoflexales bacterium]